MTKRKKGKRTNNDPQNTTQKTKDRATRTLLKNVERQFSAISCRDKVTLHDDDVDLA
jgi:hypothetical protein